MKLLKCRFIQICALCAFAGSLQATEDELSDIERYVRAPDNTYSWEVHSKKNELLHRTVTIELTSQNWLLEADVDRTEWKHWIQIIIPVTVFSRYSILVLNGGDNIDEPPDVDAQHWLTAVRSGSIVSVLWSIPNQPLVFHQDEVARTEDDLIAYAWRHLIDEDDMRFMPQAPMVKAVKRAMDATKAYITQEEAAQFEKFVLVGSSELGHVAWLTAAMDSRVAAFAPVATQWFNAGESLRHHFASLGFWSDAFSDYVYQGVLQEVLHEELQEVDDEVIQEELQEVDDNATQKLLEQLDPISYVDRLQMPKLIVNAMGDQHFVPDSSRFYWDDVEGDKYLRYIPNTGHSMENSDYWETFIAFYEAIKRDQGLPVYSWRHNADGTFEVTTDLVPTEVRFWQGTNAASRDFRIDSFGENFSSEVVEADSDGSYRVDVQVPEMGWTAYMVELSYDLGGSRPLKLTTQAYVVPDDVPYPQKAVDLPTSITLVCDATDENHVNQLKNYLSEVDVSAFTNGDLTVENRGARMYVNWIPEGRFDLSDEFSNDLDERDCSVLTHQLESGPDITFPPNGLNDATSTQ